MMIMVSTFLALYERLISRSCIISLDVDPTGLEGFELSRIPEIVWLGGRHMPNGPAVK